MHGGFFRHRQVWEKGYKRPATPRIATANTSAGVYDSSDRLVRTLWSAQEDHPNAGNPRAFWDGTLDDGTVAPSGTYEIKVLNHNVTYEWDGAVGNTSPDHSTMYYHNESEPIRDLEITAAGEIYYISGYNERWPTVHVSTTADPQNMTYAFRATFRTTVGTSLAVCSDGVITYFGVQPNGVGDTMSFLYGVNCADVTEEFYCKKDPAIFPDGQSGVWFTDKSMLLYEVGTVPWQNMITGMAVQKGAGNFLFVARGIQNKILTLNKTTGTLLQTNTTITSPQRMAVNPVTGELWLIHGPGPNIAKLTADGSGNLSLTGVSISDLQAPQALAVSPDGTTLLVADGGTSHQVKAFNTSDGSIKATWATNGVLGTPGGYVNSPNVTFTKFMFRAQAMWGGSGSCLAYAPDGSFWLGDNGNFRTLHFSSGNSPAYIEQIAYVGALYSTRVVRNEETRVFAECLEYAIDYSKPLQPGNDSWALSKNWFGNLSDAYRTADAYNKMKYATKVASNGRTYATINGPLGREMFELTDTGLRSTGKIINPYYYIDRSLNLWYTENVAPGSVCHIRKNTFAGFDGSHNPTWESDPTQLTSSVYLTTETLPPKAATTGGFDGNADFNCVEPTAGQVIPVYNPFSGDGVALTDYHFGGISSINGQIKFATHPPNPLNHGGTGLGYLLYPEAPFFPVGDGVGNYGGGPMLYMPGKSDIFTCYRGESWGNNQTNVWSHWHESGLLVGQFGPAAPYYAARSLTNPDATGDDIPNSYYSYKALDGMAGNSAWGGIAHVNGTYYLYQADEWYHGGIVRWSVANTDSIFISTYQVVWDSANYAPESDATDLLAGLPYNQENLVNGTAGWYRSPATDNTTNRWTGPWWKVYTNAITCDTRESPDIVIEQNWPNQECTLYRDLTSTERGDWTLSAILYALPGNHPTNTVFIDVLDDTNKKILRMYFAAAAWPSNFAFWVNDEPIDTPQTELIFNAYCQDLRDLEIVADVTAGTMQVTYGDWTVSVTAYEPDANISNPVRLKLTSAQISGSTPGAICITKLQYSREPYIAFGMAADRINMLKPVTYVWTGGGVDLTWGTIAANNIADWVATDPESWKSGEGSGPGFVTFSAPVSAPDGTATARKMIEAVDDVPPAYAAKPASWDLTGYSSKWSDFWTSAVAVVPAWEGTGAPHYYTAGGTLGPALTQVGTATWGAVDGNTALNMPAGENDWRIEPVASVDLVPTDQATFLIVRKSATTPSNAGHAAFGIIGSGDGRAAHLVQWISPADHSADFGSGGGTFVGYAAPAVGVTMLAVTFGAGGIHAYQRLASSIVQGFTLTTNNNSAQSRVAGNYQIGLATGGGYLTQQVGTDVLFFAILDAEWTSQQIREWMNDPYAPIRQDGGGTRVLHEGKPHPHEVYAGATYGTEQPLRHRLVVYAKAAERTKFRMDVTNGYHIALDWKILGVRATFDVGVGQITSQPTVYGSPAGTLSISTGPASIEHVGGGWYKCSMEVTTAGGLGAAGWNMRPHCVISMINEAGEIEYIGDGSSGMYFWQARLLPPRAYELDDRPFFDDFDSYDTIDVGNTLQPGYKWYVANGAPGWWQAGNSAPSMPQEDYYTISDSILTIIKDGTLGANRTLNSCSWNGEGWVGTGFKLPAMFETRAFWDNPTVASNGCPAFWTGSRELLEFPLFASGPGPDTMGDYIPTNWAILTTQPAAAGTRVLTFAYVPTFYRFVGLTLYGTGLPTPTRVASFTTTTITIDTDIVAPGVSQGQEVHCVVYNEHDFIEVRGYANPEAPHNAYETMIGLPGYTNQVIDRYLPTHPTGYDQPHDYQTLWLPYTELDNGAWFSFVDGMLTEVLQYGLTFNNASFVFGDRWTYPLWIGGGGQDGNFPGKFDWVAVYDKKSSNQ